MCFFRKRKQRKLEEARQKELERERQNQVVEPTTQKGEKLNKDEPKKVEQKSEPKNEVKDIYHVSQEKEAKSDFHKQWRVRKEGSEKTIKFFKTQKEAIEFANDLAEKYGGFVVVHRLDGKIRKQ